ncbi:MAG: glycosyltransferase family 4 protein [Candidatus Aenigmarchaeota archaeon]|nr:glycosyltransferase family 4 protein [Candidatus Aenigmarchaeota archaeon]
MNPKTLIISREFEPQIAGVSTYISELEKRLKCEKIVIAQHMPERKRKDIIGISYPKFLSSRYLKFAYFIASAVAKSVSIKSDVVVGNALVGSTVAIIVKLITKRPAISVIYDVDQIKDDVGELNAINKSARKFLQKVIFGLSDSIIVDSEKVKKDITNLHNVDGNKINVISGGFVVDNKLKAIKKPAGSKIILFVGINIRKKGLEDLVKAFARVKKTVPNCELWIVGPNTGFLRPFHGELLVLIQKLGLEKDTKFFGEVPSTSPYYKACDVFVLPSHHSEGFGIPCIEAGYFGKPVVATKIFEETGVVVRNKTALVVDPYRPSELADALVRVLTNKKLSARLGKNGKKYVRRFTWESAAKKFENVVQKVYRHR